MNARVDELRRSMAASRGGHPMPAGHAEHGAHRPRPSAASNSIRAAVARFAH
jgi:hypothetical protein